MDAGEGATLIWGVVMIVLVGSALVAQRIPVGQFFRYLLIWAVIASGVYGLVLFRAELGLFWDRARADLGGGNAAVVRGETTVISKRQDGHFWVEASIGGKRAEFMIDSGATTTALSFETAQALGLAIDRSGRPLVVMTANGPINSWPAELEAITVGGVTVEPLPVLVTDIPGSINLLGMNWLSRLGSWQVTGSEMTIRP